MLFIDLASNDWMILVVDCKINGLESSKDLRVHWNPRALIANISAKEGGTNRNHLDHRGNYKKDNRLKLPVTPLVQGQPIKLLHVRINQRWIDLSRNIQTRTNHTGVDRATCPNPNLTPYLNRPIMDRPSHVTAIHMWHHVQIYKIGSIENGLSKTRLTEPRVPIHTWHPVQIDQQWIDWK